MVAKTIIDMNSRETLCENRPLTNNITTLVDNLLVPTSQPDPAVVLSGKETQRKNANYYGDDDGRAE